MTLLAAIAVVAAACSRPATTSRGDGPTEPARTPQTWVLTSPSQVAVPAPPAAGSGQAESERREIQELSGERTVEIKAIIEKWDAQPAFEPWTRLSLELVAARPKDPVNASRSYAYVHAAINDAIVSASYWRGRYDRRGPKGAPSYPSEHAAIAGAASRVISHLFPERPAQLLDILADEAAESRVRAGASYRSDVEAGLALGRAVAESVIAKARTDGSDRKWDGARPTGRGFWDPPPGSTALPVQPLAGSWRTWVIATGSQFRPPPPPEFGSPRFIEECRELIEMSKKLTPEQKRLATFWAGGEGTPLPPGVWNEVALAYVHDAKLSTPEAARVFALINIAMADAGIAAWDAKYTYWNPRPENAIRDLGLAPGWKPYIATPFFPAYVSGHSSYSGAVAEVLAYLFPDDAALFRKKAEEAGISRLYGGIHYRSDNVQGLELGRKVGRAVVERARTG